MTLIPLNNRPDLPLALLISLILLSQIARASIAVTDNPSRELAGVVWQSNNGSAPWGAANAQRGGISRQPLLHFPPNIRRIGPQTPHSFSATLENLQLPLIARHPQDSRWIPMLASRWLVNEQAMRLYFELDADARWSDGIAVTTDDIRFTLEFLTDPATAAAWQAERLQQLISGLEVFDQQRFAFVLQEPATMNSIRELASLRPFAAHVYRNARDWPKSFDWYPEPTTGPYYLAQLNPYAQIVLRETSDWWGRDKRYFKHRFNVHRVNLRMPDEDYSVIDLLERGELDVIPLNTTENWQSERISQLSNSKRINRIQFYHQAPLPFTGLLLNANHPGLSSKSKRAAVLSALSPQTAISELNKAESLSADVIRSSDVADQQPNAETSASPGELTLSYSDQQDLIFLRLLQQQAKTKGMNILLEKVSPAELRSALQQANYDITWLRFSSPLNGENFLSLFHSGNRQVFIRMDTVQRFISGTGNTATAEQLFQYLQDESIFHTGYGYPYCRSASWQWLKLPENQGTRISTDLFDPFDAVTGGLFWIDRRQRADILAKPERGKNDDSKPHINIQYRLNNNQL